MSRPATSKRLLSHSLALYLAVLGAASMAYYHQGLFIPRSNAMLEARGLGNGYSFGNDFYQIWLASRLWFFARIDPYSPEMTRDIQIGLYGRPLDPNRPADLKDRRIFPYPAFAEILFWPAALFPFTVVRVAVLGLLIPATVATVLVWMRALSWHLQWPFLLITLLLVLCSYPALEGFYAGQVGLLVGFLFAASILSIQQGRLLQSGVLLGLTTIKPQVIVLAALYLLAWTAYDWRKRRSFCVGFVGTVLLLVGGAFVIWPHWISSWLHVVVMYRGYTGPPLVQELLTTMGLGSAATPTIVVTAACIAVALTLAWQNRSATSNSLAFWWTLGTLLAITVIALLPRQAGECRAKLGHPLRLLDRVLLERFRVQTPTPKPPGGVECDRREPRAWVARDGAAFECALRIEERRLHHILGIVAVVQLPLDEPDQTGAMLAVKSLDLDGHTEPVPARRGRLTLLPGATRAGAPGRGRRTRCPARRGSAQRRRPRR